MDSARLTNRVDGNHLRQHNHYMIVILGGGLWV